MQKRKSLPHDQDNAASDGQSASGIGFLEVLLKADEPKVRGAVLNAARHKASRYHRLSSSQLEDAYQDALVFAFAGRCKELPTYLHAVHAGYRRVNRRACALAAERFLRAVIQGGPGLFNDIQLTQDWVTSLQVLACRLHQEYKKLVGYLAVTTVNCWRGERKTQSRRTQTLDRDSLGAFSYGRPQESSEQQRHDHRLLAESLLASVSDGSDDPANLTLVRAARLHLLEGLSLNEVHRVLTESSSAPFSRATLHRRMPEVIQNMRLRISG